MTNIFLEHDRPFSTRCDEIAQMVERWTVKQEVRGSNLAVGEFLPHAAACHKR